MGCRETFRPNMLYRQLERRLTAGAGPTPKDVELTPWQRCSP